MKSFRWQNRIKLPGGWSRFPELDEGARGAGVYRLIASEPVNRMQDASPVLYIGCASNLSTRLSERHHVLERLQRIANEFTLDVFLEYLPCHDALPKLLDASTWAHFLEAVLLHEYERMHLELPPLNSRGEGEPEVRLIEALADVIAGARLGLVRQGSARSNLDEACTELTFTWRAAAEEVGVGLYWCWPKEAWPKGKSPSWARDFPHAFVPDGLHLATRKGSALESKLALDWTHIESDGPTAVARLDSQGLLADWFDGRSLERLRKTVFDVVERLHDARTRTRRQ